MPLCRPALAAATVLAALAVPAAAAAAPTPTAPVPVPSLSAPPTSAPAAPVPTAPSPSAPTAGGIDVPAGNATVRARGGASDVAIGALGAAGVALLGGGAAVALVRRRG